MAYVTIDPNEIKVGDPIKKELWDKIKSNEDDLNGRLIGVEATGAKIVVFDHTVINAASASTLTGLNFFRAISGFTLSNCIISIFEKGALTGVLEVDVKKNATPADAGMTSVFTTRPSITIASVSDYAESTNQVFNTGVSQVSAGEYLRFDVTSLPTGGVLGKFRIVIFGEA